MKKIISMLKEITSTVLVLCLFFTYPAVLPASEETDDKVIQMIDNRDRLEKMPIKQVSIDGIDYLPVKELCFFYRINFRYDPETKGVSLTRGKKTVTIIPGDDKYLFGKKKKEILTPALISEGRTLIDPKAMAAVLEDLLSTSVAWRPSEMTFTVNDEKGVSFWEDHYQAEDASEEKKVTVKDGDTLIVSVWQKGSMELDELTRERIVEDGTIKFPFIGSMAVTGLTTRQVEERLVSKLKPYLKNPEVTVRLKGGTEELYKVQIFGAVRNPGTYEFSERVTLMEAVNRAGGFNDKAKLAKVRVTRFIHHSPYQTDVVNCKLILYKGQRQFDVPVDNRDIIFVPAREGIWDVLSDGIAQATPVLSVTALVFSVIFSARAL
ncbi:MAG: polysaccharide biosynthesis/export family protein [Elusimicrobia bacterium]|nr:polysaccharide biosynthesis/export family protein [Elusimicrobiota bacterium]